MKLCLLQWLYVSILGETKRRKQTMSWSQLTKKSHACWKSRDLTYTLVNLIILKENLFGFKTNNNYIGQGILADLYLFFNCIFIVHTITDVPISPLFAHPNPAVCVIVSTFSSPFYSVFYLFLYSLFICLVWISY